MKIFLWIFLIFLCTSCGNINNEIIETSTWTLIENENSIDTQDDNISIIDEFADWSWEYFSENNRTLELFWPDEQWGVDLWIYYDDITCTGFWAIAYLEKSWVANFYDKNGQCQINLTYNPWVVEVNSYNCSDYEESQCGGFSGTYKLR